MEAATPPEGPPFKVRDKRTGRVLVLQALPSLSRNSHYELVEDTPEEDPGAVPAVAAIQFNDDLSEGVAEDGEDGSGDPD